MKKNYITYEEQDPFGNNEVFIMQKRYPNFVGKLSTKPETNWYQPVHGYNLFVTYAGTLAGGNVYPTYRGADDDIAGELYGMATFVLDERVERNPFFDKFKIKVNELPATAE